MSSCTHVHCALHYRSRRFARAATRIRRRRSETGAEAAKYRLTFSRALDIIPGTTCDSISLTSDARFIVIAVASPSLVSLK